MTTATTPLSPQDFRVLNALAVRMDSFHNYFRQSWNTLYSACENSKRPSGMSIRQFLGVGSDLIQHLTVHHGIEERHIFPYLAVRMPEFRKNDGLIDQHKEIHNGLDKLEAYIDKCKSGETELQLSELKIIMDTFGKTLFEHLDDEVRALGAENMRKYWTPDEIRKIPF